MPNGTPRSTDELMDELLALRKKQQQQAALALGSKDMTKSFDPAGNAKLVELLQGQSNGLGGISSLGGKAPGAQTPFGQDIDKFFAPAKDALSGFFKPIDSGLKDFGQSVNSGFNKILPSYLSPVAAPDALAGGPSHLNDKEAAMLGNPPSVDAPGVYGDTKIANLTPYQQLLLMLQHGSGRENPDGLPGFDGGEGGDGNGEGGSDSEGGGPGGGAGAGAGAGTGAGGTGSDYGNGNYDFAGVGDTSDYNATGVGQADVSSSDLAAPGNYGYGFGGQTFGEATGYGASAPGYNAQGDFTAGPDFNWNDYNQALEGPQVYSNPVPMSMKAQQWLGAQANKFSDWALGQGAKQGQMPGYLSAMLALAPGPLGLIGALGGKAHEAEANRQAGNEFGKGYGDLTDDERAAIDSVMADNDAKTNADTDAGGIPNPVIASGFAEAQKYVPHIQPYVAGTPYGALSGVAGGYSLLHSDDPYIGLTSNSAGYGGTSDNGLASARNALNNRVLI